MQPSLQPPGTAVALSPRVGIEKLTKEHVEARALLASGDREALASLLRKHIRVEEDVLIPLLAGHLPTNTGPLAVLVREHRTILGLLAGQDTSRLGDMLLAHMAKEEELVYPFAAARLTAEDLARLGDGGRS